MVSIYQRDVNDTHSDWRTLRDHYCTESMLKWLVDDGKCSHIEWPKLVHWTSKMLMYRVAEASALDFKNICSQVSRSSSPRPWIYVVRCDNWQR